MARPFFRWPFRLRSYRAKLNATMALLMALIIVPMLLAWWSLEQSAAYSERSRLADEVYAGHLLLAERGQRTLRVVAQGAEDNASEIRSLKARIREQVLANRAMINAEADLIGPGGREEEKEEIERLDRIALLLDQAINGGDPSRWRLLLNDALSEERREVSAIDRELAAINRNVENVLTLGAILTVIIAASALLWLQRALQKPIDRLIEGTRALASGDLSHRIYMRGDDEFAELARDFDRMVADLERQSGDLNRMNDALEDQVEARTAELADANIVLAAVAERRQRFLADISHELRTPLTIIRGEAEVMLRGSDRQAADYKASLERMGDQASGMSRLVDDLLFVARTDAGEPRLRKQPVNIAALLRRSTDAIRPMLEADGGSVTLDVSDSDATIPGDADRLQQLVLILLDNALRYSTDAPMIHVGLDASPELMRIAITDAGTGIAAEELELVFDRFRRGSQARDTGGEGQGLGLPLARSIAEAHGGTLTLASVLGEGTVAKIVLPRTRA